MVTFRHLDPCREIFEISIMAESTQPFCVKTFERFTKTFERTTFKLPSRYGFHVRTLIVLHSDVNIIKRHTFEREYLLSHVNHIRSDV